jgi:hypothetical protein
MTGAPGSSLTGSRARSTDGGEAAVEGYAHGGFLHAQTFCGFADGGAFKANGGDNLLLPVREAIERALNVAGMGFFLFGGGEGFGEIADVDLDALAAAAVGVDDLVARDGIDPWAERAVGLPGVAFEMNGQQGFLHDILSVDAQARTDLAARLHTDDRGDLLEQSRIAGFIAGQSRAHA